MPLAPWYSRAARLRASVGSGEQSAERAPAPEREPSAPQVFEPVVQQMAALAQGPDVAVPAATMARIMVEMRRRQHDLGRAERLGFGRHGHADPATPAVAPGVLCLVPPAAITQMLHDRTMRSAAGLAAALGPHESNPAAELWPVDGIEKT